MLFFLAPVLCGCPVGWKMRAWRAPWLGMCVVALAEWLRRVPAKYMGFPRKSSNLLGDGYIREFIAATVPSPFAPLSLSSTHPLPELHLFFPLPPSLLISFCMLCCFCAPTPLPSPPPYAAIPHHSPSHLFSHPSSHALTYLLTWLFVKSHQLLWINNLFFLLSSCMHAWI
uniref:Uncharacterized protein n=1 Tax=Physcomitrium patens TaxID=3218 RepID=A0A2K1IQH6_PHYPA|nr:hypothetical protein PHYPA_025651 [Physcomitrium patens]PNR31531.1 hypothetical protein PHYPA_025652 [Physcomitrium patens]